VIVTADGARAVSRLAGRAELRIVTLAGAGAGTRATVALPAEATDVDLSDDGTRAFAVLRAASTLAVIDVAAATAQLIDLGGEAYGSATIDAAGRRAVLYTNAANVERVLVVDLAGPPWARVTRPLRKAVRTAAFAPDGRTVLIVHSPRPAGGGTLDDWIDSGHGYSVLDLATGFVKVTATPADPGPFAFTQDGRRAYVLVGEANLAQSVDLVTFVVTDLQLSSRPEAVGVLPTAGVAWVSQRHPLGRVSFIDLATQSIRTLTGFDLNGHVVD
jgi:hypothetical protein